MIWGYRKEKEQGKRKRKQQTLAGVSHGFNLEEGDRNPPNTLRRALKAECLLPCFLFCTLGGDCCTQCPCTSPRAKGQHTLGLRKYWVSPMGNMENNRVKSQKGSKEVSIVRGETASGEKLRMEYPTWRPVEGLSRDPQMVNASKRETYWWSEGAGGKHWLWSIPRGTQWPEVVQLVYEWPGMTGGSPAVAWNNSQGSRGKCKNLGRT